MRSHVVPGVAVALAGGLAVLLGDWLSLDLDAVALLGVALGAVIALVPDRGPGARVGGFLLGVVIAWLGYVVRVSAMPDIVLGRAVAVTVALLLCAVVAAVAAGRIPLWSLLVGAAALAGAFERVFVSAPTEFTRSAPTAVTTVLLTAALGFLVAALAGPWVRGTHPQEEPVDQPHLFDQTDETDESVVAGR